MKFAVAGILALAAVTAAAMWLHRNRPPAPAAAFRMPIDDAFALIAPGKVVVVGVIAEGEIRPGKSLMLHTDTAAIPVTVEALEAYHKPLSSARAGDRVGIMLVGAEKDQVTAGASLSVD